MTVEPFDEKDDKKLKTRQKLSISHLKYDKVEGVSKVEMVHQ